MAYGSQSLMNHAGPSSAPDGFHASSVPDLPGRPVDGEVAGFLRRHVASLTRTVETRFPGAQPVSFNKNSLQMLLQEDFWVCEKSDGQRVLILIVVNGQNQTQEVYLIDRKNQYKAQHGLFFPHSDFQYYAKGTLDQKQAAFERAHRDGIPYKDGWPGRKDTLLDGELVWDTDRRTGQRKLRLLLFDALVVDGANMSTKPLTKRYGRLHDQIFKPFHEYTKHNPRAAQAAPFEVKVKNMDLAYGIDAVLQKMPHLEHGNDGLIFTALHSGYTFGTDSKIIKWKPPGENSIDFILRLRFPPDPRIPRGNVPDFRAKPFFILEEYMGDSRRGDRRDSSYEPFEWLWIDDDEWERMKESRIQFDDRIVECVWAPEAGPPLSDDPAAPRPPGWKILRIRDDKQDGNHTTIIKKILDSIEDGVEEEDVVRAVASIRANWKSEQREALRKAVETGAVAPQGDSSASLGGASTGQRRAPPLPIRVGPPGVKRV